MKRVLDETVYPEKPTNLVALTPRELEVLQLISSGVTNKEAARRLHVSVHAIKFHLTEIYRRLGVSNRTEAAMTYQRLAGSNSSGPKDA